MRQFTRHQTATPSEIAHFIMEMRTPKQEVKKHAKDSQSMILRRKMIQERLNKKEDELLELGQIIFPDYNTTWSTNPKPAGTTCRY